jgi:hypothetical protein
MRCGTPPVNTASHLDEDWSRSGTGVQAGSDPGGSAVSWRRRRRDTQAQVSPQPQQHETVQDGNGPTSEPAADIATAVSGARVLCADSALRVLELTLRMSSLLDAAMRDQANPDVLDGLYALDALVCQTRRVAENLHVLSDRPLLDADRQVTSVADVIGAALGRIAGWQRVAVGLIAEIAVVEGVSGDLIRVMTELLDNAVRYSPATTPVTVSGHLLHDGGLLVRVEDGGIGMIEADRLLYTGLLCSPYPAAMVSSHGHGSIQQGLQVVSRAAGTHGIRVALSPRSPQGTIATVHVPAGLLTEVPRGAGDAAPIHQHATKDAGLGRGLPALHAPAPTPGETPRPFTGPRSAADQRAATALSMPMRVPQYLRDLYPTRRVADRGGSPASGASPDDAVGDIVVFDAATSGPIRKGGLK